MSQIEFSLPVLQSHTQQDRASAGQQAISDGQDPISTMPGVSSLLLSSGSPGRAGTARVPASASSVGV